MKNELPSNKIIQYLFKNNKVRKFGLRHYGGRHHDNYYNEKGEWAGHLVESDVGEALIEMTDEEIKQIYENSINIR
jgi:hypothetical protein